MLHGCPSSSVPTSLHPCARGGAAFRLQPPPFGDITWALTDSTPKRSLFFCKPFSGRSCFQAGVGTFARVLARGGCNIQARAKHDDINQFGKKWNKQSPGPLGMQDNTSDDETQQSHFSQGHYIVAGDKVLTRHSAWHFTSALPKLIYQGLSNSALKMLVILELFKAVVEHLEREAYAAQRRRRRHWKLPSLIAFFCTLAMLAGLGFRRPFLSSAIAASPTLHVTSNAPAMRIGHRRRPSMRERATYALDSFFTVEPWGKAAILLGIVGSMTVIGGVAYHLKAGEKLPDAAWLAWSFIVDPPRHLGEETVGRRLIATPLSLGGMLFFALLIGIVSDDISSRVDELKKGRERVLETNHTLVIGWTKKTGHLVKELTVANETRGRKLKRAVVVMGHLDKVAMDDILHDIVPPEDRDGVNIVTRKGSPMAVEDLRRCAADSAHSIVVLSPSDVSHDEADARVLQVCMVLANIAELKGNVVAEFASPNNISILRSMDKTLLEHPPQRATSWDRHVAGGRVPFQHQGHGTIPATVSRRRMVPVAAGDTVLRLLVERALQPGTAAVSSELLHFEGSEFRFGAWPELTGTTFWDACFRFEDAVPCGIWQKDDGGSGFHTWINPPPETVIEEGDKLLLVSTDLTSFKLGPSHAPSEIIRPAELVPHAWPVRNILICEWRDDVVDVIRLLDSSVGGGSEVTILATDWPEHQRAQIQKAARAARNISIKIEEGEPTSRSVLEGLPLEEFDCVILLAREAADRPPPGGDVKADNAATSALYIRHIQMVRGRKDATLVAELTAGTGDALAAVQRSWLDDSILPEQLQALVLAQVAEDADVGGVLDEIVTEGGSKIMLRDAATFVHPGEVLSFWELQARVLQDREVMIAHRCEANGDKWELNPRNKSERLHWSARDQIIVMTAGAAEAFRQSLEASVLVETKAPAVNY